MQASDAQGHVAYYRVSVDANARLAKTNFRAGLYDAAAVDALFGTMSGDDDTVDQTLERRRREAVDRLAKAYYDALSGSQTDRENARRALQDALATVPRQQKFVIINSANASAVEEAIADFSEEQDTRNGILSLVAPFKREDFLQAKADADALARTVAVLLQARSDLGALQNPAAGKPVESTYKDSIRRIVNDLVGASAQ
jgi:hypothetical protein